MSKFKIGDKVKVVRFEDVTGDRSRLGQTGEVLKVNASGAGVGESEDDPFYFVGFSDGVFDGFWTDELKAAK